MMRRALLISPHFPPDATAGTHRVRLLAPYLSRHGWDPTVLTCDPSAYEGRLDPDLPALLPPTLRVVRVRVLPATLTRTLGIGDLGLRSFVSLYRAAARLLQSERFEVVFITIFPAYTSLIGRLLRRRFGVPFVLDYQDPWVNAWGRDVGGGPNGAVDLKSRASRWLAETLEPHAVRHASAITAVSAGTYEPILRRNPGIAPVTATIPIGTDPNDFHPRPVALDAAVVWPRDPGLVHLCCTGAMLPLGYETLRALLGAVARLHEMRPDLYARLRLHFIGTSNQVTPTETRRVMPVAEAFGVADLVDEVPARIPYSHVIQVQRDAHGLLALGSSEVHYTPSKIFPLLLAGRPILAIYHEDSTVTAMLRRLARPPSVRLVTYSDTTRAETCTDAVAHALAELVERPVWRQADVDTSALHDVFAESLAGTLAGVFDRVALRQVS